MQFFCLQTPVLLRLFLDLGTYGCVDIFWIVFSISKDDCVYYFSKTKHNFYWANPSGVVSGVLAVC